MLDKLKVVMLVGIALQVLRVFVPGVSVPEGFETEVNLLVDSLFAVVPVMAGWFKSESADNVKNLVLK